MITSQFSDGVAEAGAGIIFGIENDRLYIATAAHVVVKEAKPAREVQVQFRGLNKPVKASLLRHQGQPLDLAALSVTGLKAWERDLHDVGRRKERRPCHAQLAARNQLWQARMVARFKEACLRCRPA
jgi:hypothetical protein